MRKFFTLLTLLSSLSITPAAAQDFDEEADSLAFAGDEPEYPLDDDPANKGGYRPDLRPVANMTSRLLSTPDLPTLTHDAPLWANAIESYLAQASDSAVAAFRPEGLMRFEADGVTIWCDTWSRKGQSRLVWFAVSKNFTEPGVQLPDDGLRHAMAFVDDIGTKDSTLDVRLWKNERLKGLAVFRHGADEMTGEPLFVIPDARSRMALRILTDINYPATTKDKAESTLKSRLGKAPSTLGDDLSGFPEMTFCDSPDDEVRTVTYMVSNFDFTSHCGGWLVLRKGKGKPAVHTLTDATDRIGAPDQAMLNAKSWYGAIYSSIIQFRFDKKDYYALVGFKGATPTIKTRVIDVLSVADGRVVFGAVKAFRHPKSSYRRRVFQYSAKASMLIHYDENSRIIVMDHLAPSERIMAGNPEYYGPDLSYDAYVLSDNGWEFQTDIQVTKEEGAVANADDYMEPDDVYDYNYDLGPEPGSRSQQRKALASASDSKGSKNKDTKNKDTKSRDSKSSKSGSGKLTASASSSSKSSRNNDENEEVDEDEEEEGEVADSKSGKSNSSKAKASKSSKSSDSSRVTASISNRSKAKATSSSSSWSGRSSRSSRRNKSSSSSAKSWFDKGKGNSAPNIRTRR